MYIFAYIILNNGATFDFPFDLLIISCWCCCHPTIFIGRSWAHWSTLCHTLLEYSHSRKRCSFVSSEFWHITHWVLISNPYLVNLSAVKSLPCSCSHMVNVAFGHATLQNIMHFHGTLSSSPISCTYIYLVMLFPALKLHCTSSRVDLASIIFLIMQHPCWGTTTKFIYWPLI